MSRLHAVSQGTEVAPFADAIFVHGLGGHPFGTWTLNADKANSWPFWLASEIPQVRVWTLEYAADPFRLSLLIRLFGKGTRTSGYGMALPRRAMEVLNVFANEDIGTRPIMFICHSLGGLLVKQLLRGAYDDKSGRYRPIYEHTRAILFLGTPHFGVNLASRIADFKDLLGVNINVEELKAHDAHLENLGNWYVDHSAGVHTASFYETLPVGDILPVVDPTTARVGVGEAPIGLDEDHLSICKLNGRDHQVYRAVKRLVRDYLVDSAGTPGPHSPLIHPPQFQIPPTPPKPEAALPPGSTLNRQGPYVQDFVGRENVLGVFDDALSGLMRRARGERSVSYGEDCRLLWIHGYGGMGKSWLIRNAAVRALEAGASVILIDWDDPEWRAPLSFPPSSPEQLFEVIATRVRQVCGKAAVQGYWTVRESVQSFAVDHRNLQLDFSAALDFIAAKGKDWNTSAEIPAWKATGDMRNVKSLVALYDVLRQDPITIHDMPAERALACKALRNDSMRYRRIFEQWASSLLGDTADPALIRPAQLLADTLRACLVDTSRLKPMVLFLDTCELLFGELEDWLRRLVRPLVSGSDTFLAVVGSRLFPDLSSSRDTWTTDIPRNRFRSESLDDSVLFGIGEIEQLIAKRDVGFAAIEGLPEKIYRVSLGVPLAVRVVIETLEFHPESIRDLDDIDPYPESTITPLSELSQLVITTVSDRFLLHLQHQADKEKDFMDVMAIGVLLSPRMHILKHLWGDENPTARMRELSKRYSLIASGDLHLTIRNYVRREWRLNPPEGLQIVISELIPAIEAALASVSDDQIEALLIEKANLDSWTRSKAGWNELARSLVLLRAREFDLDQYHDQVLSEMPADSNEDQKKREILKAFCSGWPSPQPAQKFLQAFGHALPLRERALAQVFAGIEIGPKVAFQKVFPLLDSLRECGTDLAPALLKSATQMYLALATYHARQGDRKPLERAYEWYTQLSSSPELGPMIHGSVLRELGRSDRAEEIYREGIERDTGDDGTPHEFAHLCERSERPAEAERYFGLAAERDPYSEDNWVCWAGFQERDGRPVQALETVERGIAKIRRASRLAVSRFSLMKTLGHEDDELKKALGTAKKYLSDSDNSVDLNIVSWALLEAKEDLVSAEAFARRAVELEQDNDVNILHTLASILLAQRNWAQAKPHVRAILDRLATGESSMRQDSIDQMIADAVRVGGLQALPLLNDPHWSEYKAAASILLRRPDDLHPLAFQGDVPGSALAEHLKSVGFVAASPSADYR